MHKDVSRSGAQTLDGIEALESLSEAVSVLDRQFTFLFINRAMEALLGRTREQLLGRNVRDLYGANHSSSPFIRMLEQANQSGTPGSLKGHAVTLDRWIEQRCYPSENLLTIFVADITEQRNAQQALSESEARFAMMAASAPVMIWLTDAGGACTYVNEQWLSFTGRTLQQELGRGWIENVHPDDVAAVSEAYTAAAAAHAAFSAEYRLRDRDGFYRWVLTRGTPRMEESTRFTGFIGSCTDIHAQRLESQRRVFLDHATQVLASSLNHDVTLQHVAELAVPELADWCTVLLVGDDGVPERVAVAHADPERVEMARAYERRYPVDLNAPGGSGHAMRTGEPVLVPEVTTAMLDAVIHDPEQREWMGRLDLRSVLIVPIQSTLGPIGAITLIYSGEGRRYEAADLAFAGELASRAAIALENARLLRATQRSNEVLETRVAERTRELEVRNRELQDFAFVASHDLQEPLRKIRAFAGLLSTSHADRLTEEGLHFVDRIEAAAERMSTLIRDLLAFSRVSTHARSTQAVDLGAALEAVCSDLQIRLEETGGRVEVAAELPVVEGDPVQFQQLLLNLVGNALKFHRPGVPPVVRVTAHRTPDAGLTLVVEDNGIGFEPKYADRIFSPFQRLHAHGAYEGTGMGLAIVRRIVERHHGTVRATSTPGAGSRFEVTLPTPRP